MPLELISYWRPPQQEGLLFTFKESRCCRLKKSRAAAKSYHSFVWHQNKMWFESLRLWNYWILTAAHWTSLRKFKKPYMCIVHPHRCFHLSWLFDISLSLPSILLLLLLLLLQNIILISIYNLVTPNFPQKSSATFNLTNKWKRVQSLTSLLNTGIRHSVSAVHELYLRWSFQQISIPDTNVTVKPQTGPLSVKLWYMGTALWTKRVLLFKLKK